MFRKILIAEDHESANLSVQKTLEDYPASATDFAYYCDDALDRIEKSVQLKILMSYSSQICLLKKMRMYKE